MRREEAKGIFGWLLNRLPSGTTRTDWACTVVLVARGSANGRQEQAKNQTSSHQSGNSAEMTGLPAHHNFSAPGFILCFSPTKCGRAGELQLVHIARWMRL